MHLFEKKRERRKERRNSSNKKRYEILFLRLRSDSVQIVISALEDRPEYICSDNGEKLDLTCSRGGNRSEIYGGYIHCFWSAIYPRTPSGSRNGIIRSLGTEKPTNSSDYKQEEHRAEMFSGVSSVFHAIPGQQISDSSVSTTGVKSTPEYD